MEIKREDGLKLPIPFTTKEGIVYLFEICELPFLQPKGLIPLICRRDFFYILLKYFEREKPLLEDMEFCEGFPITILANMPNYDFIMKEKPSHLLVVNCIWAESGAILQCIMDSNMFDTDSFDRRRKNL